MFIRTLNLTNFRNYGQEEFNPAEGLNILVGANAQGKSAVLEAVYLLATSKSHRTSRDMDLIRVGEDYSRVCADVVREAQNDVLLEVVLSRSEKKSVKINKVKHEKIGDLVGQLNAVIFSNSDIEMVRGEPSKRRRFLNLEISQVSPQYVYALGRYKRVLDQRNNLLKEIKYGEAVRSGIDVWDRQLAIYGATIMKRRSEFVEFLSKTAADVYCSLTVGCENLAIGYDSNFDIKGLNSEEAITAAFQDTLASKREIDISRGTTTTGPHRDDISISINDLAAREFASQGQQRTAAIAMKLAEITIFEQSVEESPVVLLDDIMAELDETRRGQVIELTKGRCQTFITTTHLTELDVRTVESAAVFEVRSGKVYAK